MKVLLVRDLRVQLVEIEVLVLERRARLPEGHQKGLEYDNQVSLHEGVCLHQESLVYHLPGLDSHHRLNLASHHQSPVSPHQSPVYPHPGNKEVQAHPQAMAAHPSVPKRMPVQSEVPNAAKAGEVHRRSKDEEVRHQHRKSDGREALQHRHPHRKLKKDGLHQTRSALVDLHHPLLDDRVMINTSSQAREGALHIAALSQEEVHHRLKMTMINPHSDALGPQSHQSLPNERADLNLDLSVPNLLSLKRRNRRVVNHPR